MLVLYETPAGFAIFKTSDASELETQKSNLKLLSFKKYKNMKKSLKVNDDLTKGKVPKVILKAIRKRLKKEESKKLVLYDKKLAGSMKRKLLPEMEFIHNDDANELLREIKENFEKFSRKNKIGDDMKNYTLSLSHSMSTKKLKFSPEKVDLMVIQAISLLDEVDKELNNYLMRIKEWYGWHFPELDRVLDNNLKYVQVVNKIGMRKKKTEDLSAFVDKETEEKIYKEAVTSMGTDIAEDDEENIRILCRQYIEISEYKASLQDYLKARMNAIAPSLTELVGEVIGARLIAKAGSLLNLAKSPSSTIQILGAEKALFRAIKTKSNTPKYGLIYHAKLISKQQAKLKGAAARILSNNASLASRYDALSRGKGGGKEYAKMLYERVEKTLQRRSEK